MAPQQDFSLGVTQLLDEMLCKDAEEASSEVAPPRKKLSTDASKTLSVEELRNMFQRTEELCEEAHAFLALMARAGEIDAEAEAELRQKAEKCSQLSDACRTFSGTGCFFGTSDSLSEALEAHEDIMSKVIDNLMGEILRSTKPGLEGTLSGTALFETGSLVKADNMPELDLDKLLAECEAMRDETIQYRGLQSTLCLDKSIIL
eukprot:TRINITY_DN114292_c0_g1_i1.p1 TRINITY_DN114292_c0_g1~~TRINITY_DN114292_c0_g1_i1.p1  ORF type:complete len:204 (+),score=61.58 TRINITY_DN114292_c0_g1_i1:84-695(+)